MKNKVLLTLVLSILTFAVFLGGMSHLKNNGTFYLKDLEGQREYLNLFPIEGVAGDGTQGITFRLENGELSTKFYPFGSEQIRNLLFAEREGITGLNRYNYDYYSQGFRDEVSCFTDSAPSEDANIQHKDCIHEDAVEKGYYEYGEFTKGETILADKIDVYLDIWRIDTAGEARVRTGMTLQDKEYYYTRGYEDNRQYTSDYSSFYDTELQTFCVKIGDAFYAIVASNSACQGETALYRVKETGLITDNEPLDEDKLYQQDEYGETEILHTFPVDENNRILGMLGVSNTSLGIFRIENENLYLEVYDIQGNLIDQSLISKELGTTVDQIETGVINWNDGDTSIYFKMYHVTIQEDNSQVWDCIEDGLYQVDKNGLKRLIGYEDSHGKLLLTCKNNLILDVSMAFNEEMKIPHNYNYEVYLSVINGDTGKVLYRGKFETDYEEDMFKNVSIFNIAKKAPYLDEAMKEQYIDGMIEERQRQISDIVPINGKGQSIWLK